MNADAEAVLDAIAGCRPGDTGWIRTNCPMCMLDRGKRDRKASLAVSVTTGYFLCFKCDTRGRLDEPPDPSLATRDAATLPDAPSELAPPEHFLPLWAEPACSAVSLEPARRYLRGRGLSDDVWRRATLGVCVEGRLRRRIVAPMFDGEAWLGWVARDWTDRARRRYLYPKGMRRSVLLYQAVQLKRRSERPLLVVEGVFDALPYFGNAVALLGKPSPPQVKMLAQSRRPLVIALDGDAWEQGYALARKLKRRGVRAGSVRLPPGEDPGSVDSGWLIEKANNAI